MTQIYSDPNPDGGGVRMRAGNPARALPKDKFTLPFPLKTSEAPALKIMGVGWAVFLSCDIFVPLRSKEGTLRTTSLGEEVLQSDMDVALNLLVVVATKCPKSLHHLL